MPLFAIADQGIKLNTFRLTAAYHITPQVIAVDPETATPYQLEEFLNLRVSDNISVTPGLFIIFNPEGFSENRTTYVPVVRTTFTF